MRAPAFGLKKSVESQKDQRCQNEPLELHAEVFAGDHRAWIGVERVEGEPDLARLVRRACVDEDPFGLVGDRFEQCRIIMSHHDVSILVALRRDDSILHDRDRRTLRRAEPNGDNGESHLAGPLCFSQNFLGVIEALAIAHQDDCFVTL